MQFDNNLPDVQHTDTPNQFALVGVERVVICIPMRGGLTKTKNEGLEEITEKVNIIPKRIVWLKKSKRRSNSL